MTEPANCNDGEMFTTIITRMDTRFDKLEDGLEDVRKEVMKISIRQARSGGRWSVITDFYTIFVAAISGTVVFLLMGG